jgi:hypothetical protein
MSQFPLDLFVFVLSTSHFGVLLGDGSLKRQFNKGQLKKRKKGRVGRLFLRGIVFFWPIS